MHRFFVPPESIQGAQVAFPEETARQIHLVLRLLPGQEVQALDNSGAVYTVRLESVAKGAAQGSITARETARGEPGVALRMYLSLTQREKFEWMLQKCTEVGVSAFTPMLTARCLAHDAGEVERKRTRWESILREAAEQSGRGRIPTLTGALGFDAALAAAARQRLALLAWEGEQHAGLRAALTGLRAENAPGAAPPDSVPPEAAVFIGPEGGFTEAEIGLARARGVRLITLGARILRMETAAVVAAALLIYEFEQSYPSP
jgi:16S rRNA (uracil1498-N3)-methyltransferase